jgi:outer membrane lipoprotein-sorting protein
MKSVYLVIGLMVHLFAFGEARATEVAPALPRLEQVIDRLNDLYRAESSQARMAMKVVTEHYRRELTLQSWTRGKKEALVVIRAPARDAGAATLRTEEGLWSYAPRADQLVRIPSALLSDNWMGSHFTNDDLMRETDFLRDYDASLAWKEEAGVRVLQATLVPKPKAPVVWSRIVFSLDAKDFMPLRAEYFDRDKIVRTLSYGDPHVVGGRRIPFSLLMVPTAKPDESTHFEYLELKLGVPVDASLFTPRGLRRMAKQ